MERSLTSDGCVRADLAGYCSYLENGGAPLCLRLSARGARSPSILEAFSVSFGLEAVVLPGKLRVAWSVLGVPPALSDGMSGGGRDTSEPVESGAPPLHLFGVVLR